MLMGRIRKPITMTLPPELVAELDAWIAAQEFPPARAQVVEAALREWLSRQGEAKEVSSE